MSLCWPLFAAVSVLDTNNVILSQIGAALHLNDIEGLATRIGEAVNTAQRQVDRLVFSQEDFFIVTGDDSGAIDYNPMLCPMKVFL